MTFAIPTKDGKLCRDIGECKRFAILKTNGSRIVDEKFVRLPAKQKSPYSKFLASKGVDIIITCFMGKNEKKQLERNQINVYRNIKSDLPTVLVRDYFANKELS